MGPWLERQKITPDDAGDPGIGDDNHAHWGVKFGSEIALEGETMVVGTQHNRNSDSGSPGNDGFDWAYVFHRDDAGNWVQTAKLVPDDARPGDAFAFSLGLDEGAGLIVAGNPSASKIYVFERQPSGNWEQTWNASEDTDFFGMTVAANGSTILVGTNVGLLYSYERGPDGWGLHSTLEGATGAVDIHGDAMVARNAPDFRNFGLYERANGTWKQTAQLPPPPPDASGDPVAGVLDLSPDGRTVVFGAATADWHAGVPGIYQPFRAPATGSAWVYELIDGEWIKTAELPNPDPAPTETFGSSVAVLGDRIVVGAPADIHNGADHGGAAYIYENVAGDWHLTAKLRNSDGSAYGGGDWFGEAVGLTEGAVAVGAPFDDNRRDGMPPPLDDQGDVPPCLHRAVLWGCDTGENAGSVYTFETPLS